ncbi:YbfB/YjiJ family MFS transporter [Staphylococcus sp. 17KM0847]|uniref:YbfB/YjiJ family MFS transporter n=1 Tax=Staphylococcus sp. 17KM0847 TaxID=2583989 RepID=UPI0015DCE764|nr:YbfB/YjiJ family MFS transporter [Staphylococcus sp. 17KM0847]QLK85253.1 YbfB/YjiJ family MFS transporter [Staphylococcus sp. 17KM0847]
MNTRQAYQQLLFGMMSLMIVMAVGRFAYTPILPFMQQAIDMTHQEAGILATLNYLGYLIGAIIPMFIVLKSKVYDLKLYLMINIVSTLLLGVFESFWALSVLRIVSGITSGTVFVLASNTVLEALKKANKQRFSGVLYSAVGMGIFLSSIFIFLYTTVETWKSTWLLLGGGSLLLGFLIIIGMKEAPQNTNLKDVQHNKPSQKFTLKFMICFAFAYFFEGAGYIITGTFLVVIINAIPVLSDYAALSWMFVGLGAIPSTLIWSLLAEYIGYEKAIYSAFILQIIGVGLPLITHNAWMIVIASMLFGGTFLGLTTLFMAKSQEIMLQTNQKINMVSLMTIVYSLGQMLAPMISGHLIGNSEHFDLALLFATTLLLLGLLFSILSYHGYKTQG